MRVLVTGGVRCGKSRHAEAMLADAAAVTYVAPGPVPDPVADPDWAARIDAHRAARPASWTTVETGDVAAVLASTSGAVLVDCLGTWLTRLLDDHGLWEAPASEIDAVVGAATGVLGAALGSLPADRDVVLVTNEVGWGVIPAHRSGRIFRDQLGRVNQAVASVCDEVHLVVAGRVLRL